MATNAIPTLHDAVPENIDPTKTEFRLPVFRNEPFLDFTTADVKAGMKEALRVVEHELGHEYQLILGGERITASAKITSTNPAKPAQTIGIHQEAELPHIEQAVAAADKAFQFWSRVPVSTRVNLLLDVAQLVRERKLELCAW
ncbi:MAG: aldehyde dehydrogenase family protein, partial [Janthinobacterium lividum]